MGYPARATRSEGHPQHIYQGENEALPPVGGLNIVLVNCMRCAVTTTAGSLDKLFAPALWMRKEE